MYNEQINLKMAISFKRRKLMSRADEAHRAGIKIIEYQLPTLIGYWEENLALREEKMKLIRQKRQRCQTLTVRKNILFENLHKPAQLKAPSKTINYGDPLQITTDPKQKQFGIDEHVLASIVTETDIDLTLNLCHGCPVVASKYLAPCRRNLFKIIDATDVDKTGHITYGNNVYILLYDSGQDRKLYLQAIVANFEEFGDQNNHYPLRLAEQPDRYCKFKIMHPDAAVRDIVTGDDVPSNSTVCIAHTVSNRFIVTENTYLPSLFGAEMEVSCYIYRMNNKEVASNLWELTIEKQTEVLKPSNI